MKNLNKTKFLLPVLAAVAFSSCQPTEPKEDLSKVKVNPVFEMLPPLTPEIALQEFSNSDGTKGLTLTANFGKQLEKEKFHAFMLGDEKVVMRDDGKEGDEKAADGIFTVSLDINPDDALKQIVASHEQQIRMIREQKNIFTWINRSPVSITDEILKFDIKNISFKERFKLNPGIIFKFLPNPLLKPRSLMITDLGVVEDLNRTFNPCTNVGNVNGAWTFGKLITDMANTASTGVSVEDFIHGWLDNWLSPKTVNGDNIPARNGMFTSVIKPWIQKSNPAVPPASITLANWKTFAIKPELAPFKLLAIVNRLDLRGNTGYLVSNAGEGRFVFGVVNSTTCNPLTGPGKFTVIFEYGIPKKTCADIKSFAQQWKNLVSLVPGTPAYNTALQAITDQFTAAGLGGSKPNGSSLNQLRTNEFALGGPDWELREFVIDGTTHLLKDTTVKQEPAKRFNRLASPTATVADLAILANYVNTNENDIKKQKHSVPLTIGSTDFLGGKAHTETSGHFWDAAANPGPNFITNDTARHMLSINTCSGCHGGEGKTASGNLINDPLGVPHNAFLQIAPQPFGVKATLAGFLTGDPSQADGFLHVNDPAGRSETWLFNDLDRRAQDLDDLAATDCSNKFKNLIGVLSFKPINMVH